MQPPPRKGNYTKFLKNLHTEQIAKLGLKNQNECDLLEDIRNFTIKKSAIEKSYAEALLKISSAYLNKKLPNIPDIKLDGGEEKWNMWNVWRTVLEENEKLARARLAAIEIFQQQIADEAKVLRTYKLSAQKRTLENLTVVQKELQTCVQDVDKTKKFYFDEEHCAHDVRDKARDIEEKLKKKKGSFFQSITSLQKNSAKVSSKREQLEEKSTGARNDYLICLAAANAHQNRYFAVDLQIAISTMESNVFDKVAEYLTLMGRTELLTCSATQNSYGKIRDQAQQLTREYNLKCIYLYYPVLKQHIQYDFEPCDNDPIDTITAEQETAAQTLNSEAKRYANKLARENNAVKENIRKIQILKALKESGQKVDPNDPNGPDLETKIDDITHNIRRAETSKMKCEAILECLRTGGVNVDDWLKELETLSVHDIQRSTSSLSMRTDASGAGEQPSSDSFYDSDAEHPDTQPAALDEKAESIESEQNFEQYDSTEVDAMLEEERQRIEDLTAGWEDPTQVDWGAHDEKLEDGTDRNESQPTPGVKCTALYSYTAQNPDELTIVENEQLEVIGEGDGDGWLRARNYKGEEGYVPHNYLDVEQEEVNQMETIEPHSELQQQISFSSVDYTIDEQDDIAPGEQTDVTQSPEQVSVISVPIANDKKSGSMSVTYCCALYDYEGEGPDELSFEEGQIITIINKCAHGVDDGWWEGEVDGHRGNFPSLVVEECDENGEPLTNPLEETPPPSAPPVFTPPDVPGFLLQPAEVVVTQATPMGDVPTTNEEEHTKEAPPIKKDKVETKVKENGFSIKLKDNQKEQYGSQFDGEDTVVQQPSIPVVCVEQDDDDNGVNDDQDDQSDFGLNCAQIVITAATPMVEEPEKPFPPPDDDNAAVDKESKDIVDDEEEEVNEKVHLKESKSQPDEKDKDDDEKSLPDDMPTDSAPFPISSSSTSDVDSTGPSTADNSQSLPAKKAPTSSVIMVDDTLPEDDIPKQIIGGRASIPDELEPHQLAQLQDLKESNA